MTPQAPWELEFSDNIGILRLKGHLKVGVRIEDLNAVKKEMAARNCTTLVADLGAMFTICSSELGFLAGLYSSIVKVPNGRFLLIGPTSRVRQVLDLTRLSAIIELAPDLESGLASLESRSATRAR
jgi:anti-anti-sigma factor